ncbi:putative P-loop containing nucleoside triphosphate hydrolase, leucine-rich repeat domain superfamily [Helianthus annuus]|uniref:P-loop containing nucleoside triphosphate hydrolase, leucine-rich repeat domain superfamily n=1 Tax=Helianthus annuus TaxID=4232 RepID=A0A251SYK4_HELAN|nr:putative disease resistance RPP13-like protein 1 [Helianthus annuus]KAF5775750.1 putative P-loop containing nucleoside triphosphate hydrolase, leucine-rich repeat domain superfamily [Helianthus annuus]
MAEAAAAALVKVIFDKLADEAFKKYARSQNIHSELKQLGSTLSQIQALLNDASHKEITDESVRLWLNSLQHLAYDIDDVLDEVATEAMRRELTPESEASTSMVRKLIPTCCKQFSLSHWLSPKLDRITTKLQHLEKQNPGLIVKGEKPKINTNRRNETSLPERDVVGREVEKKKLLNQLLVGESSKEKFSILPIVGLGGVGKTTLARILYNDTRVKDHFELMAWVCVSDECDVFKISETIFECVATENKQFKDVNQLQIALREQFKDKRFLLVLDDVWNQNYDDWEKLVRPFHSGAAGSRVIMTTRQQDLLKKIGFNHVDNLKSLSHEDALSLLALHALDVDNFDSHETLKPQAKGIVKKCGGLPLALKAIGRLLRTKTEGEEWDDVLKSKIWDLENADAIVPALRLSYHDLPADLKRLFAYCSLFPKDFMFDKEELILLWIAEGYLNESTANKSPECLGHEYFEKLLSRSFFQPAPSGEPFFVMHDLMNDLATFVAGEYFLRFDNQTEMAEEALGKYRHMSFMRERYVGFQKFEAFQRARSLRTLLAVYVGVEQSWDEFYISNKILVDLLPQLPLLRVLSLSRFDISEVPDVICSLDHLRYLNLSRTNISKLPENVGNLYNLQTLIVFGCESLSTLPKSFLKLKKLRHFDIRDTPHLKKLPLGIGELKNLQTLPKVIVGGDGDFAITKLKGLENLRGELSIEGLQKVQIPMQAREANLSQKRLTKLKMKWGNDSQRGSLEKEVLAELKPHTDTLKHFEVEYYGGVEFPCWVGDPTFHQLVHVSLRGCRKCTSLPPLGRLPSLKELLIQGMDDVKVISLELSRSTDVTFPSLEILRFEDMSSWEVWSTNSEVMFPCLRELQIIKCPDLSDVSLEALPSLRVLRIEGCGESVLRSLVQAASSTTKLEIDSILGLTDEVWRGVIVNFGAVEELRIQYCDEIRYLWESDAEASKVLVNLKELRVYYCKKLVSLGEKEEDEDNIGSNFLSSLRILDVEECESMERLCCPNSIERLNIRGCRSVRHVSFPRATTTGGGGQNLKSLTIDSCGNLKSINQLSNSTHLTSLRISYCRNMELSSDLHQLSNLTSLCIQGFKSIRSFSDLELSNLTTLKIEGCESIESFPNLHLPNLTEVHIESCKNMKAFGDLQLPNLISWMIWDCENLESFPDLQLSNLTMLKAMWISNCPMIDASFPRGLWPPNLCSLETGGLKKPISEWGNQNFPASLVYLRLHNERDVKNFSQLSHLFPSSLKSLSIWEFDNLESISTGLQYLTSLQHLYIGSCPKLNDLPETLLPSLLSLSTLICPKLKERCEGRGSHYWPRISHIPCIEIKD